MTFLKVMSPNAGQDTIGCDQPRARSGVLAPLILLAAGASLLYMTPANAQVRYTLAPSAEYTWWDKELHFEDRALYGARIGADFGRLVGLSAYYHRSDDLRIRLSESELLDGSGAPFNDLRSEISTYGANVAFKLGVGRIVPFAHAGAGVVRIEPRTGAKLDLINFRYGGGLQYDVARNIRAQVFAEDSRLRLDLTDFTTLDPAAALATQRNNWTVGASLGFALGGALDGGGPGTDSWSLASIPIEPFAGRLEWDDSTLTRQAVVGVRSGIDVGTHFGLRGFYWQGRTDGLGARQPIQGYGAEAQFNLTSGLGPAPYLVAGASRLDFQDDFVDVNDVTRPDETAIIVGGGVGIRLTDQFRLNVSARDYIRSERRFGNVSALADITHNWMLSAGIGFNLGRARSETASPEATPPSRSSPVVGVTVDPAGVPQPVQAAVDSMTPSGRVMTLPVPATGEIYVRYGPEASRLGTAVLGRTDSVSSGQERSGLTAAEMDELVNRLSAVLERMLEQRGLERREAERRPDVAATEPARNIQPEPTPEIEARSTTPDSVGSGITVHQVSGYAGPSFGGATQMAAGVRADIGRVFGINALRLVPQFALGVGGQTSLHASLGLQLALPSFAANPNRVLQPHARLGVGGLWLTGDGASRAGIDFSYGVTFDRPGSLADDGRPRLFVEHQGIDGFAVNRFVVGLSWNR